MGIEYIGFTVKWIAIMIIKEERWGAKTHKVAMEMFSNFEVL